MKDRAWKFRRKGRVIIVSLVDDIMTMTHSDGADLTRNEAIQHFNIVNMHKAHSRPLFRLKRWFLGLRPVNNWLWRRANKKRQQTGACRWTGFTWVSEHTPTKEEFYYSKEHRVLKRQKEGHTFILPDYPSIRELSNERPEE